MFFDSPLIPSSSHRHLKNYKYAGVDKSFLSKYILQYYWSWVVQWFPLWMAPNLITFIGFCFIIFNTFLCLYYSPDLKSSVPSYCCYIFAIGIFIYQTLDAIDGKQARRTNQSSPLGHLFDHGCDALNTMLTVITITPVLGIGGSPLLLMSILLSLGNFYLTTWEEYNTGVLYLGYFSGPVEGVILICLTLTAVGYLGHDVLQIPIPFLYNLTSSELFILSGVVFILLNCVNSIWNVLRSGKPHALFGLIPFLNFSFFLYSWCHLSPHVLVLGSTPFCLFVTFAFGRMAGRMILAHILKAPFPMVDVTWVPLAFAIVNAKMEAWFEKPRYFNASEEIYYAWACALFSFVAYTLFAFRVIKETSEILDIWCFSIKYPNHKKSS